MRVIATANQKGGTAKTTTCVNLAAALGELGNRILLVDLDPQHSASSWLGFRNVDKGVFSVFVENGNLEDIIANTNIAGIDIIPASSWLFGIDKSLAGELGAETIFRQALTRLPSDKWDFILIDCPPNLGLLTINALVAAQEILVPIEAHILALEGLAQLLQTVELVRERLNPNLIITGMLACRVDSRTRHANEIVDDLRFRFGNVVYNVVIRENVRIAEAPSFNKPITEYDNRSAGAHDYRALAHEVASQERS